MNAIICSICSTFFHQFFCAMFVLPACTTPPEQKGGTNFHRAVESPVLSLNRYGKYVNIIFTVYAVVLAF